MERQVEVWGDRVTITVHQQSKSVWVAGGTYMENYIQVKGRSEGSAVGLWRDAARYRAG